MGIAEGGSRHRQDREAFRAAADQDLPRDAPGFRLRELSVVTLGRVRD